MLNKGADLKKSLHSLVEFFCGDFNLFLQKEGFFHAVEKNKITWVYTAPDHTYKLVLDLMEQNNQEGINENLTHSGVYIQVSYGVHYHFYPEDALLTDITKFHKTESIRYNEYRANWPVPKQSAEFNDLMLHLAKRIKSTIFPWFKEKSDLEKVFEDTTEYINKQVGCGIQDKHLYQEYYLAGCIAEKLGMSEKSQEYKYTTHLLRQAQLN